MSAWIRDRRPEAKDATWSGYVIVSDSHGVCGRHRSDVTLGTPWQPYPEPYVKPKRWAVFESFKKDSVFLAKDGKHVIGLSPFTYEEITAMTDALNRLEEGV